MSVRTVLTLVAWLGLAPIAAADEVLEIRSAQVDAATTRTAVEARVGAELRGWRIHVDDRPAGGVTVRLRPLSGGREAVRKLTLAGETEEERSRELAAAIALLIDEAEEAEATRATRATRASRATGAPEEAVEGPSTPPAATSPPAAETPPDPEDAPIADGPRLRGHLGLGPRVGLGPPRAIDVDAGLELGGGLHFLRDHLQALGLVGWTTSRDRALTIHYVHVGAGIAGGAPLAAHRLWIGAGVLPRVMAIRAREGIEQARLWNAGGDLFALAQVRATPRKGARVQLLASLRVGVELTLPSILYVGRSATLRRGDVRGLLAASVGVLW